MHTPKRKRLREEYEVIGFDSETFQGPPITFQFYSETCRKISGCVFIGRRAPTAVFTKQLEHLPPGRYRMYGHNLEFDMLSVLWDMRTKIRDGSIDLAIGKWRVTGRYSRPVFATFSDGERIVEIIDSVLWFATSLAKAADMVCPHLPKLRRPRDLGDRLFMPKDTDFVLYSMRDAEVAYFLGLAIEKFHQELNIPSQVSLASMAAAVFRINYMRETIWQPPLKEWMVGAAASYHGGVNRLRPNSAPAWHVNVTALDISSAYPHAMTLFPSFSDPDGYRKFSASRPRKVPDLGVYKISGNADACDWPALFNHDFKPLLGRFSNTWVSGFELNEALSSGEVSLTKVSGYHYEEPETESPFAAYVADFYKLKSDASDPVMRYMYKILLNALTGKFIQTSPDYTLADGNLVKIYRAGGLYHPFIASLITGHTRARIHQLEHEYSAIHTATDGIFVPGRIDLKTKKSLGSVVNEGHGDLALFRNKLYIFYSNKRDEGAYESAVFDDQYVIKCARHGFQGTVADLESMLVSPNRIYKTNKPIKLKTAIRSGETPNKFVTTERKLRITDEMRVITHK